VRMLRAAGPHLARQGLVPSGLTLVLCRLASRLGFAMGGSGVGKLRGAPRGLGYVISQAEGTFATTGVFAGMTILGLVVVIVSAGVTRLERWLLRWKG